MIGRLRSRLLGRLRRMAAAHQPIILMYHRVAALRHDPWELAVSPANFRDQIEHLKTVREVVPLTDILAGKTAGRGKPLAAVTFDDGYADVYANARPILQALDCPATVFLTTGGLGAAREYWWDELVRILLETARLPERLELSLNGVGRAWSVTDSPDGRRALHDEIWGLLRAMDGDGRKAALDRLAAWAGVSLDVRDGHRAMTRDEARDLVGSPLAIGAHSVTHPQLSTLSDAQIAREIHDSRLVCEEIVGGPVTTFAYPFGDYNAAAVEAARAEGFALACTVEPGGVENRTDPMLLPRYAVGDWGRERFARWLP